MKDINATVIVDLAPDEKKLFKALHKDARWGIKKAQKSGLIIKEECKNADLKEWEFTYVRNYVISISSHMNIIIERGEL